MYNKGHISTAIETIEPIFISLDYTNWKNAILKKKGFGAHEQSHCHNYTVVPVVTIPATTEDIGEGINKIYTEEKAVSHQSLIKILSNIRFLAR